MESKDVLTKEQREALGFTSEEEVEEKVEVKKTTKPRGRGKGVTKKIVEEELTPAEKARQEMLASFGSVSEDETFMNRKVSKEIIEVDEEELLKSLVIDINNIEIIDKPAVSAITDNNIVINGKPTFEVVCNQSGYLSYMESLKYSDITALEKSVSGFYAERQRIYSTIFDKINNTSVGKIDYETFLKMTSIYDVPSLLYGIYCQSFKTDVEFTIKCPHCGKEMPLKVPSQRLISIKDKEVYDNIEELIGNLATPKEAMEKALVNKRTKIVLPESKMVVELKIPTLDKYLDVIGSVKPEAFEALEEILGMMVFIDKLYKLDMPSLIKDKKVKYYQVKDKIELANVIKNLELEDSAQIQKILERETTKYAIEYAIENVICANCKGKIDKIPLDMEELTFFRIRQM